MINGVVSGFWGSFLGSVVFISTYNQLYYALYSWKSTRDMNFKVKNLMSYVASDFTSSFFRIFFEARKQLLQMCNNNISLSQITRASYLGWSALAL